MSSRTPRVAVLSGGWSAEREVSLASGRACLAALRDGGHDVVGIDAGHGLAPSQAGRALTQALIVAAPDVVFNALHGRWGEDGCVQGLLELLAIPYTHSGVLASALAMDKMAAKRAFAAAGLPVAPAILAAKADVASGHPMAPPYVVKPRNEGSSVGVHIVMAGANGPAQPGPDEPDVLMVEAYAPGREMTVAVMGDRPLCVTDIIADGWYDYAAKYRPGGSRHVCPADIPADVTEACLDYALRAHRAVGARGVSRTDFRWDEARGVDGLIVLEINTQPGMTATSLAPEQAAAMGIDFPRFCAWMVEDASCGR